MKRWLAVTALVWLVGVPQARAAGTDLRALNLTLGNLPAGFTQSAAWEKNDTQLASMTGGNAAQLAKAGRVLTSEVEFRRNARSGILQIVANLAYYRSDNDALADYRGIQSQATAPVGYTIRRMSVGPVGQERSAFQLINARSTVPIEATTLVFHRGRYVAILQNAGVQGTFDPQEILTLARAVDGHILKYS